MMAQISSSFGKLTVRRAYGDWTTPQLTPWKKVLGPLGIRPHQQVHSIRGKNTRDVARVSDAMDLIHERCVDGVCIVSSDCDFLGLASRIQAAAAIAPATMA